MKSNNNNRLEFENFTTYATLDSNLSLYAFTDKEIYDLNQTIEITATLKNNNVSIVGANVTAQILKPNGNDGNITLSNNGNGNYSALFNDTTTEGTYYITVDALGTINGYLFSRETNTLAEVKLLPDLTLSTIDITFSNNTPKAGDNITINATIHNIGDVETNATIWFYDYNNSFIGEVNIENITPNGSKVASLIWEIPKSGPHTILVWIDPYNSVQEKSEVNNKANKTINVSLAMKLRLICLTDKLTYAVSENVTIACLLQNFDGYPISANVVRVEVNGTNSSISKLNLTENSTGYYIGVFNPTVHGIYEASIHASKSGHGNETKHTGFEVIAMPDLAISPSDISLSTNLSVGQNITINITVHNIGDDNATNFTVEFLLDNISKANKTPLSLSANSSILVQFNLIVTAGGHTITIILDPENKVIEIREDNNNASKETCKKGDFNCDGVVNYLDLIEFENVYGLTCNDTGYNKLGDFDDNCVINFIDFVYFARVYTI